MNKILLSLCIASISINTLSIDPENCRDVLEMMRKNVPYADIDAATLKAAQIQSKASQVQNNLFSSNKDKQNAARQAECAAFFNFAGIYYTHQISFELFDEQFVKEQKLNNVSAEDFLSIYLKQQADQTKTLNEFIFRARERINNAIATEKEKARGSFWKPILEEYKRAHHKPAQDKQENTASSENVEKYIN